MVNCINRLVTEGVSHYFYAVTAECDNGKLKIENGKLRERIPTRCALGMTGGSRIPPAPAGHPPAGGPGRGSDSPPGCHSLPRLRFAYPLGKGGFTDSDSLRAGLRPGGTDCHALRARNDMGT